MGVLDLMGKGKNRLANTMDQLVREAIAFPVRKVPLSGVRAANYFSLTIPAKQAERIGLANAAQLCLDTIASQIVDGRVANRFVLFAEAAPTRAWELSSSVLSEDELKGQLALDGSRSANGLALLLPFPATAITVRPHWGDSITFDHSFTFGTARDNDLQIDVLGTSRRHGQVVFRDGSWELLDPGSTNGTYLNGRKVTRATLSKGDEVRIVSRLAFTIEDLPEWMAISQTIRSMEPDVVQSEASTPSDRTDQARPARQDAAAVEGEKMRDETSGSAAPPNPIPELAPESAPEPAPAPKPEPVPDPDPTSPSKEALIASEPAKPKPAPEPEPSDEDRQDAQIAVPTEVMPDRRGRGPRDRAVALDNLWDVMDSFSSPLGTRVRPSEPSENKEES